MQCTYSISLNHSDTRFPVGKWTCQREIEHKENNTEYCILHAPKSSKTSKEVNQKIIQELKEGLENRFIGTKAATIKLSERPIISNNLNVLDLSYSKIDTLEIQRNSVDTNINLEYSSVDEVIISDSTFNRKFLLDDSTLGSIDLSNSEIQDLSIEDAEITGEVFGASSRLYRCKLNDSEFKGPTDWSRAHLHDLHAHGTNFYDRTGFFNCRFSDACHFGNAVFHDEAHFGKSNIEGDVDFKGTTFKGHTIFIDSYLESPDFSNSEFKEKLEFSKTENVREATFFNSSFEGPADFSRSVFDSVSFIKCSFEEETKFSVVDFGNESSFRQSKFEGSVRYNAAKFGIGNFWGARFCSHANFTGVHFERSANFTSGLTEERLELVDLEEDPVREFDDRRQLIAKFEDSSSFDGATFEGEAEFYGVRFQGQTSFNNVDFATDVDFGQCIFKELVVFHNCNFAVRSDFSGAAFQKFVHFSQSQFERVDLKNAETHYIKISSVDIDRTGEFRVIPLERAGVVEFEDSTIKNGKVEYTKGMHYFFYKSRIGKISFDIPSEKFHLFNFMGCEFHDFDFSQLKGLLRESDWKIDPSTENWISIEHPIIKDFAGYLKPYWDRQYSLNEKVSTYMKAKNGALKSGDNQIASEFFYEEMRLRGQAKIENRTGFKRYWKYILNQGYRISCGYGEKPQRIPPAYLGTYIGLAAILGIILNVFLGMGTIQGLILNLILRRNNPQWLSTTMDVLSNGVLAFYTGLLVYTLSRSIEL